MAGVFFYQDKGMDHGTDKGFDAQNKTTDSEHEFQTHPKGDLIYCMTFSLKISKC